MSAHALQSTSAVVTAAAAAGPGNRLAVVHETRYSYSAPVSLAHHLAHLRPLQDGYQEVEAFEVSVDPGPTSPLAPPLGSQSWAFSLTHSHRHLHVRAASTVKVWPRFTALSAAASPPWEALAARLRFVAGQAAPAAVAYSFPSPHVPRLVALRAYAMPSFPPGRPVAEAAIELMQRISADFTYQPNSTQVDTPLSEVLTHRRGVCQDFAHLLCGALRMMGLPARYVSGYLLTQPPEGGAAMVGADATHAWTQLWCPQTPGVPPEQPGPEHDAWLDLDPTNNRVPGAGHVRLAVGRDYADVTPLRGVITGGGRHGLSVNVSTALLGPAPPRVLAGGGGTPIA